MKRRKYFSSFFIALAAVGLFALTPSAWAGVGSGTLTVTDDGLCSGTGFNDFDSPNHWDVFQGEIVHINISPGFNICTAGGKTNNKCSGDTDCNVAGKCSGPPGGKTCTATSPVNPGGTCSADVDCSFTAPAGTCAGALECSGDTTVFIKGKDSNTCTQDSDCTAVGETGCDTGDGLCKVVDTVTTSGRVGNGAIDVCYTTRTDSCSTATVAYCNDVGLLSNANHPTGSQVFIAADLRTVDSDDNPISTSALCAPALPPSCTNVVGSFCCGLTQGAYGAPNSVATAAGACPTCDSGLCSSDSSVSCTTAADCPPDPGLGFIPAAACQGCNVFGGDPNATTIGIHGTKSVTVNDLTTLITYLPAGGTANKFATTGPIAPGTDTHYSTTSPIPSQNLSGGGSKGNGAGVLAGQTMACELNAFLSACPTPFGGASTTFTVSGFGSFTLPAAGTLVCTKRSGPDDVLGTGDDVCQAFSYASCVAGLTVNAVVACANAQMATGSNTCGCSATDLNNALSNINVEFDQCGNVIDCGSQTSAGVFTCP